MVGPTRGGGEGGPPLRLVRAPRRSSAGARPEAPDDPAPDGAEDSDAAVDDDAPAGDDVPTGDDAASLNRALMRLRSADDPASPELAAAWRAINEYLVRVVMGRPGADGSGDRDEARQITLIKVLRGLPRMNARGSRQSAAWVRRIYSNAFIDLKRAKGRDPVTQGMRHRQVDESAGRGEVDPFERLDSQSILSDGVASGLASLGGPSADDGRRDPVDDPAVLEHHRDLLLDEVRAYLEVHRSRPEKRAGDHRRAQAALLRHIDGLDAAAIAAHLGVDPPPSKAAMYKWIERGREEVLLPTLATWSMRLDLDGRTRRFVGAMTDFLQESRRADAGVGRPRRRKGGGSQKADPSARAGRPS